MCLNARSICLAKQNVQSERTAKLSGFFILNEDKNLERKES